MSEDKRIKYNDFTGFSFDGIHSSELHIVRTGDGNRYNDSLLPQSQDSTVQVGGRDGTLLFDSNYTKKEFPISIAYDRLTDEDLRKLRNWGADKKLHKLIFDEAPYKYYCAKINGVPELKYICFDESQNFSGGYDSIDDNVAKRIYKGEGTLKFVCYEGIGRGTVLSQEDIREQKLDHAVIYIDKDKSSDPDAVYELELEEFNDVDEVQIYLSRDWLYDRAEFGAPDMTSDGRPAKGQRDPYSGKATTNHYVYQPQRVNMTTIDGARTAALSSDYQIYLFPIDLKKGFIGVVDARTGITNGKIVDAGDGFYENNLVQRRMEIVQYDPQLKVTYEIGEPQGENQEYGCFVWNGDTFEQLDTIDREYAHWDKDGLELNDGLVKEGIVYKYLFETRGINENKEKDLDYAKEHNIIKDSDLNRVFVVKQAPNTNAPISHKLRFQTNGDTMRYYLICKYKDKEGQDQEMRLEINLVDSDKLPLTPGEKGLERQETIFKYYKTQYGNYDEWKNTVDLPEKTPIWEDNEFEFHNCGDIAMPFMLIYENDNFNGNVFGGEVIELDNKTKLEIESFTLKGNDTGIIIDTFLRVIRGFYRDENAKLVYTSNIYDQYITNGDFFYIPVGNHILSKKDNKTQPRVIYEYRYF